MAATRNDMTTLASDGVFVGRVRGAMIAAAVSIANEGWAVAFHKQRADHAAAVLGSPDSWKNVTANAVATDTTVIADATQAGTVALTSGNVAAQAALVTDAHIDTAVAAQWNAFLNLP